MALLSNVMFRCLPVKLSRPFLGRFFFFVIDFSWLSGLPIKAVCICVSVLICKRVRVNTYCHICAMNSLDRLLSAG